VTGEEKDSGHFRLAVRKDFVHRELVIALNASPNPSRRAQRARTRSRGLNLGLKHSDDRFALLGGVGYAGRCQRKN
jgi:hypothetical protein